MKKQLAVLFGGRSIEHEISIITGLQAIEAIDTEKYDIIPVYFAPNGKWYTGDALYDKMFYKRGAYNLAEEVTLLPDPSIQGLISRKRNKTYPVDVYLLAYHGQYGEDGCVQGLLELANAAYTGCTPETSTIAMNKHLCKSLLTAHGIPVLPGQLLRRGDKLVLPTGDYPLFVKPNHLGSSVAVARANNESECKKALANLFRFDREALVERCIENLLEVNISVLDADHFSPVEVPVATSHALTYADKYLREESKSGPSSGGMASLTRIVDPPDLNPTIKAQVIEYARQITSLLDCSGVIRLDFMVDCDTDQLHFNELNPIPGSMAFYLWDQCSPPVVYTELLDRMIDAALKRRSERMAVNHDYGYHAL